MSEHFKESEFACPCCGKNDVNVRLIIYLEELRSKLSDLMGREVYVIINSGYRCSRHNAAVGGKTASQHMEGNASDIKVKDSRSGRYIAASVILETAKDLFSYSYPINNRSVHVDVR